MMSLYKDVQKAAARKQGVDVKEPAEVTMSNILDGPSRDRTSPSFSRPWKNAAPTPGAQP